MISFAPTEEQEMAREVMGELARDLMRPMARDCDEASHIPDDFLVEEIPLVRPTGHGDHVLFQIEKREMSTFDAMLRVNLPGPSRKPAGQRSLQ